MQIFQSTKFKSLMAACAFGLIGAAPAQAATQWDLPLAWPAGNYIVKNAEQFAQEVAQATGGEVVITTHPAGALGFKGPEMLAAVRDGLVPIGDMLLNQQTGENQLLGLESLPYLIADIEELQAFGTYYRPLLDEIFAQNNQKILYSVPWPQQQIYTKKPIATIDDLKGLKIRSYDKSSTEIFGAAGMTPVQLPWGEVLPSLAAGAIDAVATSSPSAVDGSFWELLKYGYPTRQTWNTDIVSVNLDAWNSLPEAQRQQIEAVAKRLEPVFWQAAQETDKEQMAILAKNGLINGEVSDALRDDLRERASSIRERSIKQLGPKAEQVVEAFQKR